MKRQAISKELEKQVWEKTGGKCFYCGRNLQNNRKSWHVDHILPFSRGGSYDLINLAPACSVCNWKKKDKGLFNWANEFCDPDTGERTGFFYFELMRIPVPTAWSDPL